MEYNDLVETLNTITFRNLILVLLSILQRRRCHYWIDLPKSSKFLEKKFVARISVCCVWLGVIQRRYLIISQSLICLSRHTHATQHI